jgi:c-di-GMP-binding flagellar brake protein YcgR
MSDSRDGSSSSAAARAAQLAEPDMRVVLGCEVDSDYRTFRSRVVESAGEHADLIVVWPLLRAKEHVPLQAGQEVMVELAVAYDALYAIETVVAPKQPEYLEYLALMIVGEWKRVQRRRFVRLPVSLTPIKVETTEDDARVRLKAQITDLSGGGVRLRVDRQLVEDQPVELQFAVPDDPRTLAIGLAVRRVTSVDGSNPPLWDAGCGFVDISEADRDRIVKFIFAEQRRLAREARR